MPIAVDQGVGIMVWSPLAGGLLSGKYRRDRRTRRARATSPTGASRRSATRSRLYDIVEALVAIGEARGVVRRPQVALAWLLGRPGRLHRW